MKVLFFHRWVGVRMGGAETHIKELAARFFERGHTVDFLTLKGKALAGLKSDNKFYFINKFPGESLFSYTDFRVFFFTFIFMLKSALALLSLKLRKKEYDVISLHFATEAFVMKLMRRFLRWPYVYIFEGYTDLEARVSRSADARIAITRHIAGECFNNYGFIPEVIPLGVNTSRFKPAQDKAALRRKILGEGFEDKHIFLTVCRISADKDLATLIKAAAIVFGKRNDAYFIIVGEGSQRQALEAMVSECGLSQKVKFTGRVSDEALPDYYALSDVFILTETRSGFSGGFVFLEAMASGLGIIASDAGGTKETLEDFGLLFSPGDETGLSRQIITLCKDNRLYLDLRQKGMARSADYDWDKVISRYEKVYLSAAGKSQ